MVEQRDSELWCSSSGDGGGGGSLDSELGLEPMDLQEDGDEENGAPPMVVDSSYSSDREDSTDVSAEGEGDNLLAVATVEEARSDEARVDEMRVDEGGRTEASNAKRVGEIVESINSEPTEGHTAIGGAVTADYDVLPFAASATENDGSAASIATSILQGHTTMVVESSDASEMERKGASVASDKDLNMGDEENECNGTTPLEGCVPTTGMDAINLSRSDEMLLDEAVMIVESEKEPEGLLPLVDLETLVGLLEESKLAGDILENQEVVLFIGPTGCGKTTSVLYLAGAKFKETEHKGFDHYDPVHFPQEHLKSFHVAPGSNSVTRTVQAAPVECNGRHVVLADSPGFNDSDGVEADISNGMGLIRALSRAKAVRPVLVFNAALLKDRFRSLSETLTTVTRMFRSNTADVDFSKFVCLFTHCSCKDSDRMHRKLASFRNDLREKPNPDLRLLRLLDAMIAQSTPRALFIHLEDEDYTSVLQHLFACDFMGIKPEVFSPSLNSHAGDKLRREMERRLLLLELDLKSLSLESCIVTVRLFNRLSASLPLVEAYLKRATDSVVTHYLRKQERIQSLWQNVWEGKAGSAATRQFLDDFAVALSNLQKFRAVDCLNLNPDDFVAQLVTDKIKIRPKMEGLLGDAPAMIQSLKRIHSVAAALRSFPASRLLLNTFEEDLDRMIIHGTVQLNGAMRELSQPKVDLVEIEKRVVYVTSLLRYLELESFVGSSGSLVLDRELKSIVAALATRTRNSIQEIQALTKQFQSILVSEKDVALICVPRPADVAKTREFVLALSSAHSLVTMIQVSVQSLSGFAGSLDNAINECLERFFSVATAQVEVLKMQAATGTDVSATKKCVVKLIRRLEEAMHFLASSRSWTVFDTQRSDGTWRKLCEAVGVLNLVSNGLDEQASKIAESIAEATRSARRFLKNLRTSTQDLPKLLLELCELENWCQWQGLEGEREKWSGVAWRILTFQLSSSKSPLNEVMGEIAAIVQSRILSSAMQLKRISVDNALTLLREHARDVSVFFAFLRIPKQCNLGERVMSHGNGFTFANELRTTLTTLGQCFLALSKRPGEAIASRQYPIVRSILTAFDDLKEEWDVTLSVAQSLESSFLSVQFTHDLSRLHDAIGSVPSRTSILNQIEQDMRSLKHEVENVSLSGALQLRSEHERIQYFSDRVKLIKQCSLASVLESFLPSPARRDALSMYNIVLEKIDRDLEDFDRCLSDLLRTFPNEEFQFHRIYERVAGLETFVKCFADLSNLARRAREIQEKHSASAQRSLATVADEPYDDHQVLAKTLILLKKASREILCWSSFIERSINSRLAKCVASCSSLFVLDLAMTLQCTSGDNAAIAQQLLGEHSCFEGIVTSVFGEVTAGQDIQYVLNGLGLAGVASKTIHEMYEVFQGLYKSLVQDGLVALREDESSRGQDPSRLSTFKLSLVTRAKEIVSNFSLDYTEQVVSLSAHLFAYWSILNLNNIVLLDSASDLSKYLMKPHAAQVVAIWRMLNCPSALSSLDLEHHLVELKTGEGKSIVLGVTSSLLALFGFHVNCVCYSTYLSERDSEAFQALFKDFGVENLVWYGTLVDLFHKELGSKYSNLAESVLLNSSSVDTRTASGGWHPTVLLIDEVDVFFGEQVFGMNFFYGAPLRERNVESLVLKIWEHCDSSSLDSICRSKEYRSVLQGFPSDIHSLIEWETQKLHQDAIDVKAGRVLEYVLTANEHIKYKHFDGLEAIRYGYQTDFLYVKEFENQKVSESTMKQQLRMAPYAGMISFAELPHSCDVILGVTGTLKSLRAAERGVLEEMYEVRNYSYVPSVFGSNKLKFAGDTEEGKVGDMSAFASRRRKSQCTHFLHFRFRFYPLRYQG